MLLSEQKRLSSGPPRAGCRVLSTALWAGSRPAWWALSTAGLGVCGRRGPATLTWRPPALHCCSRAGPGVRFRVTVVSSPRFQGFRGPVRSVGQAAFLARALGPHWACLLGFRRGLQEHALSPSCAGRRPGRCALGRVPGGPQGAAQRCVPCLPGCGASATTTRTTSSSSRAAATAGSRSPTWCPSPPSPSATWWTTTT